MKPWKGIRRLTVIGIGQPSTLAVENGEPTHVVLPVRFDRGTALLMVARVGAQEIAKRLVEALTISSSGDAKPSAKEAGVATPESEQNGAEDV